MRGEIFQNGLEGEFKGYAWVRVMLDPEDQAVFAEDDSVAIGRYEGSVLEFLQPTGGDNWTGAPARLKLTEPPRIAGNYADFLIQPAYVDQLSDMPYDIYLEGKNGEIKGKMPSVYFDNVQYSPLKGTNTVQSYEPDETADQEASAASGASVAADSMEMPAETYQSDAAAQEEGTGEQPLSMDTQPQGEVQQAQYQPEYPNYMRPRKSGALVWVIIIIAILLLAGAGGAYYYLYKDQGFNPFAKKDTPTTDQPKEQAKDQMREDGGGRAQGGEQRAEDEAREQARRRAEEMAEQARQNDTATRVNQFFAGQRDPVTAMRLAQEVPKETSEQKDAVFRLYYYAAQQGDPDAIRLYAESIDPSKPAWGTIKKDGAEAWDYYGRLPDGQQARAQLKAWTEAQARTGNSTARAWLESME